MTAQPHGDGRSPTPWLIPVITGLGMALVSAQLAFNGILPVLFTPERFGISLSQVSYLVSINYAGAIVGAALGGRLADRSGRLTMLVAAMVLIGLGPIGTGLSTSYEALLASRFLTGLGIGAFNGLLFAYYVDVLAPASRGPVALGVSAGAGLSGMLAILALRAVLQDAPDRWPWIFHLCGLLAVLVALLLTRLPAPTPRGAGSSEDDAERSFAGIMRTHGRSIAYFALLFALMPWSISGFFFTLTAIADGRGYDAHAALLLASVAALGSLASLLIGMVVINRLGRPLLLILTGICTAASVAIMALFPGVFPMELAASFGVMFGAGLAHSTLLLYAAESFPDNVRGRISGAMFAINRLVTGITPLVLTAVLLGTGQDVVLAIIGGSSLLVALLAGQAISRRLPGDAE